MKYELMGKVNTDLGTFVHDFGGRVFRLWQRRTPGDWTPYEMEKKFSDESRHIDSTCSFVRIVQVIELPNKDVLLGCETAMDAYDYSSVEPESYITYYKLSEVDLAYCRSDNEVEDEEMA